MEGHTFTCPQGQGLWGPHRGQDSKELSQGVPAEGCCENSKATGPNHLKSGPPRPGSTRVPPSHASHVPFLLATETETKARPFVLAVPPIFFFYLGITTVKQMKTLKNECRTMWAQTLKEHVALDHSHQGTPGKAPPALTCFLCPTHMFPAGRGSVM